MKLPQGEIKLTLHLCNLALIAIYLDRRWQLWKVLEFRPRKGQNSDGENNFTTPNYPNLIDNEEF